MMVRLAVTVPAVFQDDSLLDGIQRLDGLGIEGVEFYDWTDYDLNAVLAQCNAADLKVVATLSAGAGGSINEAANALTNPDCTTTAVADIERSIEVAENINCPNLIVTVGPEQADVERSRQRDQIVTVLEKVAPAAEDAGVTIILEPLNVTVDHPGYFLTTSAEGFTIVERVGSPNVKLLYDTYHQQITEGNIIQTIQENIDHVGHVHIADVPGRHEPGTGELNYPNIFAALDDANYEGYVGCEFMPTIQPVDALEQVVEMIDAY